MHRPLVYSGGSRSLQKWQKVFFNIFIFFCFFWFHCLDQRPYVYIVIIYCHCPLEPDSFQRAGSKFLPLSPTPYSLLLSPFLYRMKGEMVIAIEYGDAVDIGADLCLCHSKSARLPPGMPAAADVLRDGRRPYPNPLPHKTSASVQTLSIPAVILFIYHHCH